MVVLRRSIRRSRHVALALVVLTFLGTNGSWHVDPGDPDFVSPLPHNHSAHHERLTAKVAATAPAHCAICHWLQTFRTDGARQSRDDLASAGRSTGPMPLLAAIRSADTLNLPSRAPPSSTV
jgi:hypothetical protein